MAIARAFAGKPRALLLDEVTSALDPELVGEVLEAVRDLKAEGMTMVIATHEMTFAREVADEVASSTRAASSSPAPPTRSSANPAEEETRRKFLARLLEAGRRLRRWRQTLASAPLGRSAERSISTGTFGLVQDLLGDRAEEGAVDAAVAVGAHHEEVVLVVG